MFWGIGLAFSTIFGIRGWYYTLRKSKSEDAQAKKQELGVKYGPCELKLHCFQDAVYNFVCTFAGFAALLVDYRIFIQIKDNLANINTGTGLVFSFLLVFSAIAVSGSLPRIIYRHGLSGAKS